MAQPTSRPDRVGGVVRMVCPAADALVNGSPDARMNQDAPPPGSGGTPMSGGPTGSPGRRLRAAWEADTLDIPGVFSGLVARLAERLGFRAVYLSGAALSASLGLPDVGLVTATEFASAARELTAATSLPLLCDADTGFGEALNAERTVRLLEAAGAAGLHLEDQQLPKRCGHLSGKQLVSAEEMAAKLRAACAARA